VVFVAVELDSLATRRGNMTKFLGMLAIGVLSVLSAVASSEAQDPSGQTFETAPAQLVPVPNLPGNLGVDLVFTPITPCRIIDTRLAGGAIGAGTTRNFVVGGTVNFAGQGGNVGGCGVPLAAAGAFINFVAVTPAGPGDLRVTPLGTAIPTASFINYSNLDPGLNVANGVASALGTAGSITIQADVSAVQLVADVMGFYNTTGCPAATVKANGECYETSTRAATSVFSASDTCKAAGGRLATGCELRSFRGGSPLTLDGTGEWIDSVYINAGAFNAMIIADTGGFATSSTITAHPFRCVFRPLP
jgi:hypothetical protein